MTVGQPHIDEQGHPGAGLYLTKDELQDAYEALLLVGAIGKPVTRNLERGLIRCQGIPPALLAEPWHPVPGKWYAVQP